MPQPKTKKKKSGKKTRTKRDEFFHLHVHTEFSMLDGESRANSLAARAAAQGDRGLADTDHGNLVGWLTFQKACDHAGIKSILGYEAYTTPIGQSRLEKPVRARRKTRDEDDFRGEAEDEEGNRPKKSIHHAIMLAETDDGIANIIKMSSRGFMEGNATKPRIDYEVMADHSKGVIATSGCLGGEEPQLLLHGDFKGALEVAATRRDIFGKDNYLIEIQDHGIADQRQVMEGLLKIAAKLDLMVVASNDTHYTNPCDAETQDALLCIGTGSTLMTHHSERFSFKNFSPGGEPHHYLKTAQEMHALLPDRDYRNACSNTIEIAERCNARFESSGYLLPKFPLPPFYKSESEMLRSLTYSGAKQRFGKITPEIRERLEMELSVIEEMGFQSYFLICWDICAYARKAGIRGGAGRGSGAGSAVVYSLFVTHVNPIQYGLMFERFLNPYRVTMPDIDMDFDDQHVPDLIDYAIRKYGRENTAKVMAVQYMRGRSALRSSAKVLGQDVSRIIAAMPDNIRGQPPSLSVMRSDKAPDSPEDFQHWSAGDGFRELLEEDPEMAKVVDLAIELTDRPKAFGEHAAAVLITPGPVTDYFPVLGSNTTMDENGIPAQRTQCDGREVEELGGLKMDFLSLMYLRRVTMAVRYIEKVKGESIDPSNETIPCDDPKTFKMLQAGMTAGVFQAEAPGITRYLVQFEPKNFDDIGQILAAYRPGPMDNNWHTDLVERRSGRQKVTYFHKEMEPFLAQTHGRAIYQEQLLDIIKHYAGYSIAQADMLRRAIGKKDAKKLAAERQGFVEGVVNQGYDRRLGEQIFNQIETWANYGFNKSHSYGYADLTLTTAYLKAHYPWAYYPALANTASDANSFSMSYYLREAVSQGTPVLGPCINLSSVMCEPEKLKHGDEIGIRFGLSLLRSIRSGAASEIVRIRGSRPYESIPDMIARIREAGREDIVDKEAIVSLAEVGAFDSLASSRSSAVELAGSLYDMALSGRKTNQASKADALFSESDIVEALAPDDPLLKEMSPSAIARLNMVHTGISFSNDSHPMKEIIELGLPDDAEYITPTDLADDVEAMDEDSRIDAGDVFNLVGMILVGDLGQTGNGKRTIEMTIEDEKSSTRVKASGKLAESLLAQANNDLPSLRKALSGSLVIANIRASVYDDRVTFYVNHLVRFNVDEMAIAGSNLMISTSKKSMIDADAVTVDSGWLTVEAYHRQSESGEWVWNDSRNANQAFSYPDLLNHAGSFRGTIAPLIELS